MRLAVLSDPHVLGPREAEEHEQSTAMLGHELPWIKRRWRRSLQRVRRRFWVDHPHAREASFRQALDEIAAFSPDWVVANGDYGGDTGGFGLSDQSTFESVAGVVEQIRQRFENKCRFVFGDHEIGKYSTALRQGGIRLESLQRGEEELGIRSFWHERVNGFHLMGVNSLLFTLELFLPEARVDEIPTWKELREKHIAELTAALDDMPDDSKIVLFCHDPSALSALMKIDSVKRRLPQIECTVLGHYHAPSLLALAKLMPNIPKVRPKYPVARITMEGVRGAKSWAPFKPIICPSTFGAGHHVAGGVLFLETNAHGELVARRHRLKAS